MTNVLNSWIDLSKSKITELGFTITTESSRNDSSMSVNIDGDKYIGTICFWAPDVIEIQFNDCLTGEVVYLKTENVKSVDNLSQMISVAFKKLSIV